MLVTYRDGLPVRTHTGSNHLTATGPKSNSRPFYRKSSGLLVMHLCYNTYSEYRFTAYLQYEWDKNRPIRTGGTHYIDLTGCNEKYLFDRKKINSSSRTQITLPLSPNDAARTSRSNYSPPGRTDYIRLLILLVVVVLCIMIVVH